MYRTRVRAEGSSPRLIEAGQNMVIADEDVVVLQSHNNTPITRSNLNQRDQHHANILIDDSSSHVPKEQIEMLLRENEEIR